MENSTAKEENKISIKDLLCTIPLPGKHWIFFSAVDLFFSITAIFGNILILIALHKESSLHPPSKLLYRCLAITDLLVGLTSQPSNAIFRATLVTDHRLIDFCFYTAVITTVSFTILSAVSLLTMTAISVDRLLALLLGLRYRHIVTLRRVRAVIIFSWITSITFASMSFWKYAIPKTYYNSTLISLCILVSAISYSKIFLTLRHNQTRVHQHQGQPNGGGIAAMKRARYRKTVSTAMSVLVALVACYLPYSIVIAIVTILGSSPFLGVSWALAATLVYLNSSLNPIIYCWKIREIKQEVKNTIRQLLCLQN